VGSHEFEAVVPVELAGDGRADFRQIAVNDVNGLAADALYFGDLPNLIPGLQDAEVAGLAAAAGIEGGLVEDNATFDLFGDGGLEIL
jgi:hypothetical protein